MTGNLLAYYLKSPRVPLVVRVPQFENHCSREYEHFVQVSSNQKHVFIMFAGVRCGQESISKQP